MGDLRDLVGKKNSELTTPELEQKVKDLTRLKIRKSKAKLSTKVTPKSNADKRLLDALKNMTPEMKALVMQAAKEKGG